MVTGMDNTKVKKKPWKTRMERDIILHKDLKEAYIIYALIVIEQCLLMQEPAPTVQRSLRIISNCRFEREEKCKHYKMSLKIR